MKGKREADNNFNFKSEKLDELRSRVDAAFDEHGDEAWEQIKGIFTHPKRPVSYTHLTLPTTSRV